MSTANPPMRMSANALSENETHSIVYAIEEVRAAAAGDSNDHELDAQREYIEALEAIIRARVVNFPDVPRESEE